MLALISPSKTLDFSGCSGDDYTSPNFIEDSKILVKQLKKMSKDDIGSLMHLSPKLAELNYGRYKEFSTPFTPDNARQAIFAFKGDVYDGLDVGSFSSDDLRYSNCVLKILSGLYGLLRPLDLIQPYRLEMGTKLENPKGKDLYQFWGNKIADELNLANDDLLVNLASNEYFKAINKKRVKSKIITPAFKDYKNGDYKSLMLYVKQARGMMAGYIIKNRIENEDGLKDFDGGGYKYNPNLSNDNEYVFTRKIKL